VVDADQRGKPLAAAIAAPIANTAVCTIGTGMPMACAIMRSCVVARIQTP
jgi:acyl CoA:acetate/3-ketoacid CoA transferase beta subunit